MNRPPYAAVLSPSDGVLSLSGEIDQDNVHRLAEDLARHSRDHHRDLTVDVTGVVLLSSVAVHALLNGITRAQANGAELRLQARGRCIAAQVLAMSGIPYATS